MDWIEQLNEVTTRYLQGLTDYDSAVEELIVLGLEEAEAREHLQFALMEEVEEEDNVTYH